MAHVKCAMLTVIALIRPMGKMIAELVARDVFMALVKITIHPVVMEPTKPVANVDQIPVSIALTTMMEAVVTREFAIAVP